MAASCGLGRCVQFVRNFSQNGIFLRNHYHRNNLFAYNCSIRSFVSRNGGRITPQRLSWTKCISVAGVTGTVGLLAAVAWGSTRAPTTTLHADTGTRPKFKVSRSIKNDGDLTGLKLTLYQYQTCPFCCKLRAFLDFYGISYDVIEVNSVWRTQIKWSKYRKVPILVCEVQGPDGFLQMNDSSVIISILESFLEDRTVTLETLLSYYPCIESKNSRGKTVYEFPNKYFIMYGDKKLSSSANERKEERKWRLWADDVLVHMLSPNVYRTVPEALQAFRYFSDVGEWEKNFSKFERLTVIYVGALAMYVLGKVLKRRYNLDDDVRKSLYDSCQEWTKAVGNKRKFMGGDEPNLADLAVYGTLSSIEGCDAFQELLINTQIRRWFYDTKAVVNEHLGQKMLHRK